MLQYGRKASGIYGKQKVAIRQLFEEPRKCSSVIGWSPSGNTMENDSECWVRMEVLVKERVFGGSVQLPTCVFTCQIAKVAFIESVHPT